MPLFLLSMPLILLSMPLFLLPIQQNFSISNFGISNFCFYRKTVNGPATINENKCIWLISTLGYIEPLKRFDVMKFCCASVLQAMHTCLIMVFNVLVGRPSDGLLQKVLYKFTGSITMQSCIFV